MATIGVTRGLGDHDLKVHDSNIYIKPFLSSAPEVPCEIFVYILYSKIFVLYAFPDQHPTSKQQPAGLIQCLSCHPGLTSTTWIHTLATSCLVSRVASMSLPSVPPTHCYKVTIPKDMFMSHSLPWPPMAWSTTHLQLPSQACHLI